MADVKISELTGATTPLAGTEVVPVVQGGATVKVTLTPANIGAATAAQGSTADSALQDIVDDTTPTLGGTLDGGANEIGLFVNKVVSAVSGAMTAAAHGGCMVVTSGNVTVPTTAGFSAIIVAGGAHTVTFNGAASAAMATGDLMTVAVQSSTVIHAVLTAAADKVAFA